MLCFINLFNCKELWGCCLRVLYITNTNRSDRPYLDPAVRYRCYNPVYDLRKLNHVGDVVTVQKFDLEMINCYDVFVFHKPPYLAKIEAAVGLIEKKNKIAIADYDDLVFDEKNALSSSLFLTNRASEKIVKDIFKRNHKALLFFKNVTVSTIELHNQVRISNRNSDVSIFHNGLNIGWIDTARKRFKQRPIRKMISYFCGTKSHDHDFAIVEDSMLAFLNKNPEVKLRIVGPLSFNENRFTSSQVLKVAAVPYEDLPKYIMQSDINIAPLEDNLFNRCKSGLKFFEAAAFGIPTIASPIPDIVRFSDCEKGIAIAKTGSDWFNFLEYMLNTPDRHNVSQALVSYAYDKCISMTQTKKWVEQVERKIR